MSIIVGFLSIALGIWIGRLSTAFWRTEEQDLREDSIDYWARQREAPTFEVGYDWERNQRQTKHSAAFKEKFKRMVHR